MKLPIAKKTEPASLIIPFGKHRGLTVEELLAIDRPYVDWALSQPWLEERYAAIHSAFMSNGASTDDTPAHNLMQARFLDPEFRQAFLRAVTGKRIGECLGDHIDHVSSRIKTDIQRWKTELTDAHHLLEQPMNSNLRLWYGNEAMKNLERLPKAIVHGEQELVRFSAPGAWKLQTACRFEQRGIDVEVKWGWTGPELQDWERRDYLCGSVGVELKPTMGDDYPTTMRQMQRLRCNIVMIGEYIGRAVPEEQVRSMFAANGCMVIEQQEVEITLPKRLESVKPKQLLPF